MRLPSLATWAVCLPLLALSPTADAKVFDPTTFQLPNGLQVVVVENHRSPIVSHMVWYRVGSADEPAGKSGIAHLLEHLMFKGTPTIPPGDFSKIVARLGGRDNAFTSTDYTAYFQNIAVSRLEQVMQMEADRMRNLTLDEENFRTERAVVLEERRSRTDNSPSGLLAERVGAALYLNHPYRRPIIGWEAEIAALERQDALDFYKKWYAPNNAILVVAGDVKPQDVKVLAEKYYGPLTPEVIPPRVRAIEPPQVAARIVTLEDPRVTQPSWTRQFVAPSSSASDKTVPYALEVLSEILGGGSTSRFYKHLVVEKGLASGASVGYDASALDQATFVIAATPRPGVTLDTLQAAVVEELDRVLKAAPITPAEVAQAKARLKAGVAYARDSLHTGARTLGEALTTGQTVEEVEAWPDRIAEVTVEQVNAAAKQVLDERASVTGLLLPSKRLESTPARPPVAPLPAKEIR